MNSLLFLSSNNFEVTNKQLYCKIRGWILVLFYSTNCKHCHIAVPEFRNMPNQVQGCNFGMINISTNAEVVQMTKQTDEPIRYVPLVILFINGQPIEKMQPGVQINQQSLRQFLVKINEGVKNGTIKTNNEQSAEKKIPPYTVGVPVCDGDVCYISYEDAYKKLK